MSRKFIFNAVAFQGMINACYDAASADALSELIFAANPVETAENKGIRACGYALKNSAKEARNFIANGKKLREGVVHDSGDGEFRDDSDDNDYLSREPV